MNLRGRLVEYDRPAVMAIVNATPDSFYGASRSATGDAVERAVERALAEGADMIDVGAYSSRPGADDVDAAEERRRIVEAMRAARRVSGDAVVSVDTFRAATARAALDEGADIINDISGGTLDDGMFPLVAERGVPYVVMHMRGTPQTMASLTDYSAEGGVTAAVMTFLAGRLALLRAAGVNDVIADPGFGFAKSGEQNYELLANIGLIGDSLGVPVLAGLSRKSMFFRPMGLTAADVLPATCAANFAALERGASILRVHDAGAARQAVEVYCSLSASERIADCQVECQ